MADPAQVGKENNTPASWSGGTPVAQLASDTLPVNPQRVIRTFATDLAAVSEGKQAGLEERTAPKKEVHSLAQVLAPTPPNRAPEPKEPITPRLPPIEKQGAPVFVPHKEETTPPKRTPLPVVTEEAVREKKPSFFSRLFTTLFHPKPSYELPIAASNVLTPPANAPVPQRREMPAPAPIPARAEEEPLALAIPSAEGEAEIGERDAVLARLRARVDSYTPPAAPPVFPSPKPEDIPRFTASTPTLPDTGPLRTYTGDVSAQVDTKSVSAFSVLASAADAPRSAPSPATNRGHDRGLAYALSAGALFVGGSLLIYFAYAHFAAHTPVGVKSNAPEALITGDDETTISGRGAQLLGSLGDAANAALPIGNVRVVYLAVASTTSRGQTTVTLPGGFLVRALEWPAPDILLRNIGDESTVGIVHAGGETRAFFILVTPTSDAQSYERLFAGMFSWEPSMGRDLAALYPSYEAADTGSETATSTGSSTPIIIKSPGFIDEVVANHDVRALKDAAGHTILVYGFRDRQTLIIARDETAFNVLLARMAASSGQ
jgi:hypothetical protein